MPSFRGHVPKRVSIKTKSTADSITMQNELSLVHEFFSQNTYGSHSKTSPLSLEGRGDTIIHGVLGLQCYHLLRRKNCLDFQAVSKSVIV